MLFKKEVRSIARKHIPINLIVYLPGTETGKRELAQRIAEVHADFVHRYINKLTCPTEQKVRLLDAVISDASSK